MSDEHLSLGEAVTSAREAAGMTVEQVSATTRIRATLVRDLEQGRTELSGGAVYARGHLKSIAAATGADPAVLLAAYDRQHGAPPRVDRPVDPAPIEAAPRRSSLQLPSASAPERTGPRWGVAVALAAAALVSVIAVGSLVGDEPADTLAVPAPEVTAPVTPDPPVVTPPPDAVASLPPVTGAALRLRVLGGASWVSVTDASGARLFEGIVPDGTTQDYNDPASLRVVVGDAGNVSLVCGGMDVAAGGPGEVQRFTCSPSGLVPA